MVRVVGPEILCFFVIFKGVMAGPLLLLFSSAFFWLGENKAFFVVAVVGGESVREDKSRSRGRTGRTRVGRCVGRGDECAGSVGGPPHGVYFVSSNEGARLPH